MDDTFRRLIFRPTPVLGVGCWAVADSSLDSTRTRRAFFGVTSSRSITFFTAHSILPTDRERALSWIQRGGCIHPSALSAAEAAVPSRRREVMEEEKMGVADTTSETEAGDILSIDDLKNLNSCKNVIAIAPEYEEAILELEAQGFRRQSSFDSGGVVVFLSPPNGGGTLGFRQGERPMTAESLASPTDTYPVCSTGESKDLPPVTLSSGEIKEDVNPRKDIEEKVMAHVIFKPSIEQHDSHAMLRFTIDEFHFVTYDMTNTDNEKGYFIHSASVTMAPQWKDPQPAMEVWPAADAPQAFKTTGKEGNVALAFAAAVPSLTVGGAVSEQLQVSSVPYTLQREELGPKRPKSMVGWKWQMRTWGDSQDFNPLRPQVFRPGKVPPLPFAVRPGENGGVASFTAKVSKDGSRMQASWPVDAKLLLGAVGKFEMEVKVCLELDLVYSKTYRLRLKDKIKSAKFKFAPPISVRQATPSYKKVNMMATFAV